MTATESPRASDRWLPPVSSPNCHASEAAVGLYAPTLGLPLPNSCLRTIGVAGAAPAPSPSCGGDLRECLRLNADLRQTLFGRYVTADDVARCMEAFNVCIRGGARACGNRPPPPSTPTRETGKGLPPRFVIKTQFGTCDCIKTGDALNCTMTGDNLPPG